MYSPGFAGYSPDERGRDPSPGFAGYSPDELGRDPSPTDSYPWPIQRNA